MKVMIGAALRACQRRAFAALALALALILAPCGARPAWALADWFGVEASAFDNTLSGTGSIDDHGVPGTGFDFKDTLGIDDHDTSGAARFWFRWGKKNRLFFDYTTTSHSGSVVLDQPLVFNGTTYAAGERFDSDVKLDLYQARYRYSFLNLKVVELGLGLGLNEGHFKMDAEGSVNGAESVDRSLPFPTVAAGVVIKPLPAFHIRLEGDGVSATVSGDHIRFVDWRAQVEWYFLHFFGVVAGYRSIDADVRTESDGEVDIQYKGPYAGLGVKF
jgi:hypothetical protein